jgi:hypothetical protein
MSTITMTITSGPPLTTDTYTDPLAVLVIDANGDGATYIRHDFTDARMIAALLQLAERMSAQIG